MIPKIANFGLLRLGAPGEDILEEETCVDICFGTPAYMPPEAFRIDISAKWDVWSFGVVSPCTFLQTLFQLNWFIMYTGITFQFVNHQYYYKHRYYWKYLL